jgi:hypothetical protein
VVIGGIGIVLLLVYGVGKLFEASTGGPAEPAKVSRNAEPGIDGIIAANAPASQFLVGDCLNEFTGPLGTATIVTCQTPHTAQLIGIATLDDTPYPGDPRVTRKAEDACKAIKLDAGAALQGSWNYEFSRPSEGTWAAGDRSVACFLSLSEGTVNTSVLPVSQDAA